MTIVDDESVRQHVPADDQFLEEVLGFMFDDVYQRLSFNPFGEVVDGNGEKLPLTGY